MLGLLGISVLVELPGLLRVRARIACAERVRGDATDGAADRRAEGGSADSACCRSACHADREADESADGAPRECSHAGHRNRGQGNGADTGTDARTDRCAREHADKRSGNDTGGSTCGTTDGHADDRGRGLTRRFVLRHAEGDQVLGDLGLTVGRPRVDGVDILVRHAVGDVGHEVSDANLVGRRRNRTHRRNGLRRLERRVGYGAVVRAVAGVGVARLLILRGSGVRLVRSFLGRGRDRTSTGDVDRRGWFGRRRRSRTALLGSGIGRRGATLLRRGIVGVRSALFHSCRRTGTQRSRDGGDENRRGDRRLHRRSAYVQCCFASPVLG
ncbi:Uncharacterised protein [Mycobacteroides abscessus subsp. abscessus]|nr:Uncharacterised protein [Mycobacteroides abscessus subsp. abscessus]